MNSILKSALCAALLLLPGICSAQYPERVISLIVAYPPGGGTKITVVNRAGAGGEIGFAALAPAQYEALVRDADVTYRALWTEMPWADK